MNQGCQILAKSRYLHPNLVCANAQDHWGTFSATLPTHHVRGLPTLPNETSTIGMYRFTRKMAFIALSREGHTRAIWSPRLYSVVKGRTERLTSSPSVSKTSSSYTRIKDEHLNVPRVDSRRMSATQLQTGKMYSSAWSRHANNLEIPTASVLSEKGQPKISTTAIISAHLDDIE